MPYCHNCASSYAELLPWCPDCGTVNNEDAMDEWEDDLMGEDDLVAVFDATDEIQALLYRSMLEEAGIDVIERPMEEPWLEGVMVQALHSQLLVREDDAERAYLLVESFRQEAEEGGLAEDTEYRTEATDTGESHAM